MKYEQITFEGMCELHNENGEKIVGEGGMTDQPEKAPAEIAALIEADWAAKGLPETMEIMKFLMTPVLFAAAMDNDVLTIYQAGLSMGYDIRNKQLETVDAD